MKLDLLNRAVTAAALVALAVTLGVWLTRSSLTAAPPTPSKAAPKPTLAPPQPRTTTSTTEVQIEVEIAPPFPVAKPAEPRPTSKPFRGRGLFRRR